MIRTIDDLKQSISNLELERDRYRDEREGLNLELVQRNTEFENLQQQNLKRDQELEERQKQLRNDFELLANKILEEKSEKFTLQNKENIKNILNPLEEKIKTFEKSTASKTEQRKEKKIDNRKNTINKPICYSDNLKRIYCGIDEIQKC